MQPLGVSRRRWIQSALAGAVATTFPVSAKESALGLGPGRISAWPLELQAPTAPNPPESGAQRLSLEKLRAWENLAYGMFIHFGLSTFLGQELPNGKAPASLYNPDRLDVDQWIQVARDAGMKYAVLTTKHVAGHCLWPSRHTTYSVARSGNRTDVVRAFVRACERRGVLPGFYYCSWDNHHLFGSFTPSMGGRLSVGGGNGPLAYTTSLYQDFQTAQLTELLSEYGPVAEVWIDIPGVLGQGFRTFLYNHIAGLQPDAVIMMNSGIDDGSHYRVDYAWPSDLIAIERNLPPAPGHQRWREIAGRRYYLPAEMCDPIGKEWFFVEGDLPKPDAQLLEMFLECRKRGANLLLDVPPDTHGLIPDASRDSLFRLRKNAKL
jgi:alpha-L-fucosidase